MKQQCWMDIRQQRTMIHEKWETNKASPMIALPLGPGESFQAPAHEEENPGTAQWLRELKKWSWESGVAQQLQFSGQSTREERAAQRESQRSAEAPLKLSAENWPAHGVRKPPSPYGWERNTWRIRQNKTLSSPGPSTIPVPISQARKAHQSSGFQQSPQRVLPQ